MATTIQTLIIDDSPEDVALLVREMRRGGFSVEHVRVDTPVAMQAALERDTWDLILSDHSMPHFSALAALQLIEERRLDVPVIVVSGVMGENAAVAAMKAGAVDYVNKNRLARLNPAIRRALREREVRRGRREAEAALQETNHRLAQALEELERAQAYVVQQERLRALGVLASGVAHDINNSLSPILGYTDLLLRRDATLSQAARTRLEVMRTASEHIAHTVSRLRLFYRHRAQEQAPHLCDLNAIVEQVVTLTRPRWKDLVELNGTVTRVRVEADQTLPSLHGYEGEIRDALTHVVMNALDAMPRGGAVTIRTGVERWQRQLAVVEPVEHVLVEVCDTGVGMTEAVRQRCLEPFFSTRAERGTGLGLAIAYGVMERHGGVIEVESEVNVGTTVRLVFPFPSASGSADSGKDRPGPPQSSVPAGRPARAGVILQAIC